MLVIDPITSNSSSSKLWELNLLRYVYNINKQSIENTGTEFSRHWSEKVLLVLNVTIIDKLISDI